MAWQDYDWFEPTEEALAAVRETNEAHFADIAAGNALKEKFGAKGVVTRGSTIAGFCFDGQPPNGWSERLTHKGERYFLPKRISNAGKKARDDIAAVRYLGMERFQNRFGGSQFVGGEEELSPGRAFKLLGPVFHTFGERLLVGLPKGVDRSKFTLPVGLPVRFSEALAAAGE